MTADYYLANDINCSGFGNFEPIGIYGNEFTGTFDGKGYKITNLYINRPSTGEVGLFGCTGSGSEIKNVSLEEVNVSGYMRVGGLVGFDYEEQSQIHTGTFTGLVEAIVWAGVQAVVAPVLTHLWIIGILITSGQ